MQDKTGNNEQTDRLASYMKRRLDTHRLPVDEACWEEIAQRLPAAAPLSRPRRRWWRVVAAAVLFGGLAGLFFWPDVRRPQPTAGVVEKGIEMPAENEKSVGSRNGESTGSGMPVTRPTGKELAFRRETTGARLASSAGISDTVAGTASADGRVAAEKKKKVVSGPEEMPGGRSAGIRFATRPAASARHGWLLAVTGGAGVGAAGVRSSSAMGGQQNDMANDPLPAPDYKPLLPVVVPGEPFSAEDYSEADYALPLSFGVMARKNFNDRLALESGLVYTYLSSRFAASGSLARTARLELHYIGIPLNLVVYAWNHPRWNVYFTAGGMVEKGVKSFYTQQVFREGQQAVLSREEGIGGVQWSLNFSAGAEYRFYKAWSFYLEPRLSRYFDNDQPASYRTAHAWNVGLSGGIRYAF